MASTLAAYSIPPINYIGTVLFIAYIVAALELTNHLTTHIFALYESRSKPSVPTSQRPPPAYILLFASLAALSFAVLSYHMVSFLAQEYSAWCAANGLARGMAPRDLMPKLWAWMTDSTLFATFARELVGGGRESRGGREWAWTGMAVAGWMALGQWMGKHGQGDSLSFASRFMKLNECEGGGVNLCNRTKKGGAPSLGIFCSGSDPARFVRAESVLHYATLSSETRPEERREKSVRRSSHFLIDFNPD
ncbi:MAG: hypothetical protein M1822_004673 [Bathelium mastoideum]|nr:MAG: hypothetical protein M1822_004673 [Bathelium mastoideum]